MVPLETVVMSLVRLNQTEDLLDHTPKLHHKCTKNKLRKL